MANKTAVLNSYKNGMPYSVEIILEAFERIAKTKRPALMFFSSDHGVCLGENNETFRTDCKNAYHIPFVVYANDVYYKNIGKSDKWKTLTENKDRFVTEHDYFETISSLSGITHKDYSAETDISSSYFTAIPKDQRMVRTYDNSIVPFESLK